MIIQLPTKKGNPNSNPEIDFKQLVLIGANGAGKTRFGSNIEQRYSTKTHRISAQKSLSMPFEVSPKSKIKAELEFQFGYHYDDLSTTIHQKFGNRWGNKPNTYLLDDYEKLMVLLHTEEYEESLKFKQGEIEKPTTKLDKVQYIWEKVLPHRKLIKKAGIIETYPTGQKEKNYNATEMSDGERVIFYLVGEVICAQPESIVIIDEPEMHIHKSLIKTLFDLIEIERPDCTFIYLTHDIDFAFTRQNALKIWCKSYENNVWDYEFLNDEMPIPEQLYLEVLGSRKPVIFIEGDNSSIDYEIYEQVYSEYTLKPLGGCEKVIQSVKSFNEQNAFHHINSFGIIDRDRRQDSDLAKLNSNNIWVLDVAEAENLLLIDAIIIEVAKHMGKNEAEVLTKTKENLISFFNSQLNSQILIHFKELLRREYLSLTNFEEKNISEVITEIDKTYQNVDKQILFESIKEEFKKVVIENDYDSVIRLFNLKNALIPNSKICELTGVKDKEEYRKLVITILKKNNQSSQNIKEAIDKKIKKNVT